MVACGLEFVFVKMENLTIRRYVSLLESENKSERRRALESLRNEIDTVSFAENEFQFLFKKILRMLSDSSEACRELSVNILENLMNRASGTDCWLPFLIPVLVQRIGNQEIVEVSEEVRLLLVVLFRGVISKVGSGMSQYLDESVQILRYTLDDPYPKIKQESCVCASELARNTPHFHMQSESLVKPLLLNFIHQHSRIRLSSIQSIGDVVRYGDGKSLEVVVGSLGERLLDRVVAVRLAVARVVGDWLLHLRDRYSHFHRLLPLLLSCTCDEMDEVRAEALELWDAAGRQFLKENEEELKDRMDFLEDTPQHYPPDVRRPNLGCRVLAQRNASKVLPALERELGDWIPDARLKASQLLGVLLLNAESHMTQHLEKILGVLCRACADTDPAVGRNAEKAAELVGYFVVPGVYCRLLLPALEADPGPGHLRALAGVLRGSERAGLAEQLPLLADLLQGRHLRCSRDAALQLQLLGCCAALMLVCREDCRAVSQQLFAVLLSVLALGADGSVARRATDLMEELRTLEGVASMADLYARHISPVLRDLEADDAPWTAHSPKRFIFQAVVQHSGEAICSSLEAVGRIMVRLAKPDADPEVKVKMFTVVSALFLERHSSLEGCSGLEDFVKVVIEDVVAGNLVWRAGRTAEAVRAAAVTLLWAVLRGSAPVPRPLVASCLPLLLSLVEDSLPRTRLTALRALARLARAAFTADTIHKVLPAASQRLDDVSDDVRSAAVSLIVSLCDPLPADFDVLCSSAVVDALYSTMLLHLDDPAPSFQAIMLDALKKLAHVNPRLLHEKVHASLSVSRNTQGNEILLAHVEALLASTSS